MVAHRYFSTKMTKTKLCFKIMFVAALLALVTLALVTLALTDASTPTRTG